MSGLQRRYGPYQVEEVRALYEYRPIDEDGAIQPSRLRITALVRDDYGDEAGALQYSVARDHDEKLVVTNELTDLNPGYTGQGFSTAFSAATEDYFRRSGVDRLQVTAAHEDGGAAWAKAGYSWDPAPDKWKASVDNITGRLDRMLADTGVHPDDKALLKGIRARLAEPFDEVPSAQELVNLAGRNPKLGDELMRGSCWHGMKQL